MSEGPGYMPSSTPEELCEFLFGELEKTTKRTVVMNGRRGGKSAAARIQKEQEEFMEEAKLRAEGECVVGQGATKVLVVDNHIPDVSDLVRHIQQKHGAVQASPRNKTEKKGTRYAGQPLQRAYPKFKKNEPCPCGSGLKYKKCHMKEWERQYAYLP